MKSTKKLLAMLLCLCLAVTVIGGYAAAEEAQEPQPITFGENGEFSYTFDPETGLLIILGEGELPAFDEANPAPWSDIADQIARSIVDEGITSIPEGTFDNCVNMTSIALPSTIKTVDEKAFQNTAVESVEFNGEKEQLEQILTDNNVTGVKAEDIVKADPAKLDAEVKAVVADAEPSFTAAANAVAAPAEIAAEAEQAADEPAEQVQEEEAPTAETAETDAEAPAAAEAPASLQEEAAAAAAPVTGEQETAAQTAPEETTKAAADEAAQQAIDEATQQAANETAQQAADEAAQDAANEAAQTAADEAAQQAADEAAQTAANEAAQQAADEAAQTAADEAAQQAADEAAQQAANEAAQQAADEAAQQAADEAARKAAEEAAQIAAEEAAQKAAEEAAKAAEENGNIGYAPKTEYDDQGRLVSQTAIINGDRTQIDMAYGEDGSTIRSEVRTNLKTGEVSGTTQTTQKDGSVSIDEYEMDKQGRTTKGTFTNKWGTTDYAIAYSENGTGVRTENWSNDKGNSSKTTIQLDSEGRYLESNGVNYTDGEQTGTYHDEYQYNGDDLQKTIYIWESSDGYKSTETTNYENGEAVNGTRHATSDWATEDYQIQYNEDNKSTQTGTVKYTGGGYRSSTIIMDNGWTVSEEGTEYDEEGAVSSNFRYSYQYDKTTDEPEMTNARYENIYPDNSTWVTEDEMVGGKVTKATSIGRDENENVTYESTTVYTDTESGRVGNETYKDDWSTGTRKNYYDDNDQMTGQVSDYTTNEGTVAHAVDTYDRQTGLNKSVTDSTYTDGSTEHSERTWNDENGKTIESSSVHTGTDGSVHTYTSTYDNNGQQVTDRSENKDAAGNVTYVRDSTYSQDQDGNRVENFTSKGTDGQTTGTCVYDANDQTLKSVEDYVGENGDKWHSESERTNDGGYISNFKETRQDGTGYESNHVYDAEGNTKTSTWANYDENGNLTYARQNVYSNGGNTISYTDSYAGGQTASGTIEETRDANGDLLSSVETGQNSDGNTYERKYVYENGQTKSSTSNDTYSDGSKNVSNTTWSYDDNGSVQTTNSVYTNTDGSRSESVYQYSYDQNGEMTDYKEISQKSYDSDGNLVYDSANPQ